MRLEGGGGVNVLSGWELVDSGLSFVDKIRQSVENFLCLESRL